MKKDVPRILALSYFVITTIVFSAISLNRYNQGQMFFYDFGIFAHIIWQLSRLQIPMINHIALGEIIFLGDHFNPGLALFAPLFWITSDLRILLIQQATAISLSGLVLYKIAEKWGTNAWIGISSATAYLVFAGTLNPLVTDWHPEPTAALLLLLFFYFFVFTNKIRLSIIIFILFLLLKESNAISMLFLLIWVYFLQKEKRKKVIIIAISAVLYFIITTRIMIPVFSGGRYLYTPDIPYNPITLIQNFINSPEKQKLIFDSFASFGFTPILSGIGIIAPLFELAVRLAPDKTIFNNITLGQHYNVLLACFLALTAISGLRNIQNKTMSSTNKIVRHANIFAAIFLVIASLYTARKITGSPINVIINPIFIRQFSGDPLVSEIQQKTSSHGSVLAQNNILAYLSNRTDDLYLLNPNYTSVQPDIIVFDLREGQNINNYYGTTKQDVIVLKDTLSKDISYSRTQTSSQDVYIFEKKK